VSQATMETNAATSLGNPHIPSTTITTRCFPPPNQPSPVWTTMVLIASTSGNGLILSMAAITAPFTQSATCPLFSYEMPGFDMNSILSYSTLQTLGLGQGDQMLLCKYPWGEFQLPITLSLTEGVIYLLHPLSSVVLTNTLSGQM
jgi:hypothetical protein